MQALALFERDILLWIHEHLRFAALTPVMRALSMMVDKGILWIALTLVLLLFRRTRRVGIYCAASIILTFLIVNGVVKPLVGRTRPYDLFQEIQILVKAESDFCFPSGHTANSFAVAWILFRMTKKRYGILAVILAALVALSRLYVGVHYPTDVLAGMVIAIALAEVCLHVIPKCERKYRRYKKCKAKQKRKARQAT